MTYIWIVLNSRKNGHLRKQDKKLSFKGASIPSTAESSKKVESRTFKDLTILNSFSISMK